MFDYKKFLKDLLQNVIKDLIKEAVVNMFNDGNYEVIFKDILYNTTEFVIF